MNSLRPIRVFVVDDSQVVATTLAVILSARGFNASPFTNPNEALEAARLDAPDVLVTEVIMPEVSGIEMAGQILKEHPECKVLLISGSPETSDLLELARAKGSSFEVLPKPVPPEELIKEIQRRLEMASDQPTRL